MTKEVQNSNDEGAGRNAFRHSGFVIRHSFVIRASSFFLALAASLNILAPARADDLQHDGDPRWESFYLHDGDTVVFLGDSITYSGQYIEYIDAYLATQFPNARFKLINRGMPSETVAGTSEAVHNPPRPDLATRFERTIGPLDPDVVIACYGMNDGIYHPPDAEILKKYQAGVQRLMDRVRKQTRARLVLLSPPPFDFAPNRNKAAKPDTPVGYTNPAANYDETLAGFSKWLLTLPSPPVGPDEDRVRWRSTSPLVVDLHTPINQHLAARRKDEPGFMLAQDGIHLNTTGHWLMAQQVLMALGAPSAPIVAEVAANKKAAISGDIQRIKIFSGGVVKFTWTTPVPMPYDPQWDTKSLALSLFNAPLGRYQLRVTGLAAGRYDLSVDGRKFAMASDSELAEGLDLRRFADFPAIQQSTEVLKLVRQRQALQRKRWLKMETHPRLAGDHAKLADVSLDPEDVTKVTDEIQRLCQPRAVKIVLTPLPSDSKPGLPQANAKEVRLRDPDWQRDASPQMGLQGHRANQSSRRNAGSAAMLDGPTMVFQVFVSDKKSNWDDKRKDEIRRRCREALEFIRAQGLKYQQRVEIAEQIGKPVTLDEEISSDSQADSAWTERVIEKSTGLSCAGLIEKIRNEQKMQNVLLMLHVNKPGRSYNISYYRGVPKDLMCERLICFTHFNARDQTPAATYAHEILHGFGAGDLYFPFDQDDDRYLRAKRLFPNDVMLRIDARIGKLSIDEWTAYRVGWLKTLRPELRFLEDPR